MVRRYFLFACVWASSLVGAAAHQKTLHERKMAIVAPLNPSLNNRQAESIAATKRIPLKQKPIDPREVHLKKRYLQAKLMIAYTKEQRDAKDKKIASARAKLLQANIPGNFLKIVDQEVRPSVFTEFSPKRIFKKDRPAQFLSMK